MRLACKPVLLVLLSALLASSLYARQQTPSEAPPLPRPDDEPIHFEHLTTADGLFQVTVYSIVQDRKGFMWFGTQNGLNKYDGYKFTFYEYDPDDSSSVQGGFVLALHEDAQGRLWVGSVNGGLSYLGEDDVSVLYEDSQGALWVGTSSAGLNRFDRQTETFTRYTPDPRDPTSLLDGMVWTIEEDSRGGLWIGTGKDFYAPDRRVGGLSRFDRATGTFTHYRHDPDDPGSISPGAIRALQRRARLAQPFEAQIGLSGQILRPGHRGRNTLSPRSAGYDQSCRRRYKFHV